MGDCPSPRPSAIFPGMAHLMTAQQWASVLTLFILWGIYKAVRR